MSIPFDQLRTREVLTFSPGETKYVRVSSVRFEQHLTGTLDDGTQLDKPGIVFTLEATSPPSSAVEWRLWNKRSIGMFQPLIETNAFRGRWLKVTRTGQGPTSDYVPVLMPESFTPG